MQNLLGCFSSTPQSGSMAYEVFNKLPKLPLGGLSQFISNGGNLEQILSNFGGLGGITKNIGSIGGIGKMIPGGAKGPGGLDFSRFLNLIPKESIKGSDSNLKDLIVSQQDGVIKKILKSNYSKLVKDHQEKGGKWTDPDFPPEQSSIGKV